MPEKELYQLVLQNCAINSKCFSVPDWLGKCCHEDDEHKVYLELCNTNCISKVHYKSKIFFRFRSFTIRSIAVAMVKILSALKREKMQKFSASLRCNWYNILLLIFLIPASGRSLEYSDGFPFFSNPEKNILYTHSISMQYRHETPFSWKEDNNSSLSFHKLNYELQYDHIRPNSSKLGIAVFQTRNDFAIEDSSTYVEMTKAGSEGIRFTYNKPFTHVDVGVDLKISNSIGLEDLQFQYARHWNKISFRLGLEASQQSWNLRLGNDDNHILTKIYRYQSLAGFGLTLHSKLGSLIFNLKGALPVNFPESPTEALSLSLQPYHSSFEFSYNYPISEYSSFIIGFSTSMDTVNADMEKLEDIIGKIFALDQKEQKLKLEFMTKDLDISLTYREFQGDLSSYVLASPFGSLFTQLSGARYYQKVELNLSFLNLGIFAERRFRDRIEIGIKNSLYIGKGSFYERHYIFQLFNPLTDLSIQEIKINSFVLDHIDLQIQTALTSNSILKLRGGYIFPLHLDYETHPGREIKPGDLSLGAKLELQFQYYF